MVYQQNSWVFPGHVTKVVNFLNRKGKSEEKKSVEGGSQAGSLICVSVATIYMICMSAVFHDSW